MPDTNSNTNVSSPTVGTAQSEMDAQQVPSENVAEMVTLSRVEHERILSALKEANAEAAKHRIEIKELLPKIEKGSEAEKSLLEYSTKLEASERKAAFYEDAIRPGIDCRNPKAAYALAVADNLFDRKGNPDWSALKAAAPELFGRAPVVANAGAGTNAPPKNFDMNARIRQAAGRQ